MRVTHPGSVAALLLLGLAPQQSIAQLLIAPQSIDPPPSRTAAQPNAQSLAQPLAQAAPATLAQNMPVMLSQPQSLYVHSESNLKFPLQLAGARRLSIQNYDDPRLGVAVSYQIPGVGRADFYVYRLDASEVPTGIDSPALRVALANAHVDVDEAVRRGAYESAEAMFPESSTYELPNKIPRLYFTAYRLQRASQRNNPMVSWLFMTGMANHFVKVRVSHGQDQMSSGQDRVSETLSDFFAANRAYW